MVPGYARMRRTSASSIMKKIPPAGSKASTAASGSRPISAAISARFRPAVAGCALDHVTSTLLASANLVEPKVVELAM